MAPSPSRSALLRLLAGPLVGALSALFAWRAGLAPEAVSTAAITGLTATWWVLEPLPIPAASLVPFAALPLAGVLSHKDIGAAYGHPLIMLLMGGFMLSTAMAASRAHRRLAVGMVKLVGGGRKRLVLGFMLATAVCSMWISNTATVLVMLPVAVAILERDPLGDRLAVPLLLGIAWASSIGGLGTPVGTPPNVVFLGVYEEVTGRSIGFARWMMVGIPLVAVLLPIAWALLVRGLPKGETAAEIEQLGPLRSHEARVLGIFALTALAWVTRTAPFGGWSEWLDVPEAGDATVAFAALVLLFTLPSGDPSRVREGRVLSARLLHWDEAREVPWGLLLLFGGGIAIAKAFETSGLGAALGSALAGLVDLPMLALMLVICLAVTFVTEVTSNTATTTLLMPVLAATAVATGTEPALLMAPAAISASCAFMLPVATAPNAIVFGTDRVPIGEMARRGLVLNLLAAAAIAGLCSAGLIGLLTG
ncbi:MAG: SLC13/DASS family transporter [Alphaproteobacteria bacterium]|nr:SLC13/DASS family transporter [Alphaproteobacteria bacterium]